MAKKSESAAGKQVVQTVSYELMLIVRPLVPEEIRNKLLDSIAAIVAKSGGVFELKDSWGKRHLAYKIKGHDEGYYLIYRVELPTNAMEKLKQAMRLMPDIVRFIVIKESEL